MCDHLSVTKYMGDIRDFKMQLRRQMQQANLIDADAAGKTTSKYSSRFSNHSLLD
jgi:hypothetical protein